MNLDWREIVEGIQANLYISDMETDRILYMSDSLKREIGMERPEGEVCWRVLQRDMSGHCAFCRIDALLEQKKQWEAEGREGFPSCVWLKKSPVTGKTYRKLDTLIRDGEKLLHLQYTTDVTDYLTLSREADQDELTGSLNRRAGKGRFKTMLQEAKKEGVSLVAVLCDVNGLKKINDLYGHLEGDRMLQYVFDISRGFIGSQDMAFRLGGDEFVMVFYDYGLDRTKELLKEFLEELEKRRKERQIFYSITFSYGAVEVKPEENLTVDQILEEADKRMYRRKREFYEMRARQQERRHQGIYAMDREEAAGSGRELQLFSYEKDPLFSLLQRHVKEDLVIGYLKEGTFQYSERITRDFDLPGRLVKNAASAWSQLVHPKERRKFLEQFQTILEGDKEEIAFSYRAMDRKGGWVTLTLEGTVKADDRGQPDLFIGVLHRKETAAALPSRPDSGLLPLLVESMAAGFEGFSVAYLPQIHAETGKLYGAEALLRWHSRERGDVKPMEILPVLEESDLIIPMGRWLLRRVMADCRDWCRRMPEFHLSLNISYRQFMKDDMVNAVAQVLREFDIAPERLSLELTETALIRETPAVLDALERLKALGVSLTMDDFGAEETQLETLKKVPVDHVKIDRALAKGLTGSAFDRAMLHSVVELCHSVGKSACMEGVETQEEYERLAGLGLDYVQGYYVGRPMTREEMEETYIQARLGEEA